MPINATPSLYPRVTTERITLDDGLQTSVHVARYPRGIVHPKLVVFEKGTRLPVWCRKNGVTEALVGGFFLRADNKPLGELWIDGIRQQSTPFTAPWGEKRGSLHITEDDIQVDYRHSLPSIPTGDMLQAGPLLVKDGLSLLANANDDEGFSAAWHQFDSDITDGRHPRAAIGINDEHIFSIVCDGRHPTEAGMTLAEMAEVVANLGCDEALNLDGGGSTSLVSGGQLINTPRGDDQEYPQGRPIFTALIFASLA